MSPISVAVRHQGSPNRRASALLLVFMLPFAMFGNLNDDRVRDIGLADGIVLTDSL